VEVSETQAIKVAFKVGAAVAVELRELALMALVALEGTVALHLYQQLQATRLADEVAQEAMRLGTVE
jgi:hypothetical protein